jgi:hypothetical protein
MKNQGAAQNQAQDGVLAYFEDNRQRLPSKPLSLRL